MKKYLQTSWINSSKRKSSDLNFFKRQPYVLKETDVKEKLETTTESNTNGKVKSFLKFNKLK
jgi:hypothetical protein